MAFFKLSLNGIPSLFRSLTHTFASVAETGKRTELRLHIRENLLKAHVYPNFSTYQVFIVSFHREAFRSICYQMAAESLKLYEIFAVVLSAETDEKCINENSKNNAIKARNRAKVLIQKKE